MFTGARLVSWLTLRTTSPDVAVAQLRELRRQIPLLYALLTMNAFAVGYTHYRSAPAFLTVTVPSALALLCVLRIASWLRTTSTSEVTPQYARSRLRRTIFAAGTLGAAYISWSLALDQYGSAFERGHIAVFIATTVIGCIFCLMHLPQAALLLTGIAMVPYLVHYGSDGNAVSTAIAFNVALVTVVLIRVLFNSFASFTGLVQSQGKLAAKQREAEQLSRENALLAHTDSLTGLPNRRFFFSKLDEILENRSAAQERFAVGVLDLDRFKPLNDTYGHAVGDRLLAGVGARLRQSANNEVIVARLGGDEFGLLILSDADHAEEIGQQFCDLLVPPFNLGDFEVSLGGSCGIAIYPEAGTSAHELFDRSDYALYHVKSESRGGSGLFSPAHETTIRSGRALENTLREANLEAELDVQFQPIVDTETMTVIAVEALARWTSPGRGPVPADSFIAVAERTGLIHAVTIILFRKAIARTLSLPSHIGLSFNLSAHDITSPSTIETLIENIRQGPISPGRITFEITETALLRDFDAAEAAIQRLRTLGVKIALDDFGTGYSSLAYLRRLAPDKIKVDKSFAADLGNESGREILAAILCLCDNLSLDCVVEGVENEYQLRMLQGLGCRYVQGFLVSRPLSMEMFINWLEYDPLRILGRQNYGKNGEANQLGIAN